MVKKLNVYSLMANKLNKKPNAQQRFASMATSGFSVGKSAAEWNVLLYL